LTIRRPGLYLPHKGGAAVIYKIRAYDAYEMTSGPRLKRRTISALSPALAGLLPA
jgi:hypothetical protein